MADYIERQSIYNKISEMEETAMNRYLCTPWDSPAKELYRVQLNERTALKHIIAYEPAANVREDVHGKCEIVTGSNGKEYMVCTNCRVTQDLTALFTYCPNCGARMDGGDLL